MAQDPFSPDAWTRARNRFVEDLTDEEQVRLHPIEFFALNIEFKRPNAFSEELCFCSPAMIKLQVVSDVLASGLLYIQSVSVSFLRECI